MRTRSHALSPSDTSWPVKRRVLLILIVLTVLVTATALTAWLTRGGDGAPPARRAVPSSTPSASSAPPPAGTGTVPRPPTTTNPISYAKAAATMLWSYDTRTTSRDEQLAGMRAWMPHESRYSDWNSVAALVADPVLWSRMADQGQHASATTTAGYFPAAFQQALAANPTAITQAYIYAVTVTGKQRISWAKGGSGAQDSAVTLAVQCRPASDCELVAVAPNVAP